MMKNVIFAFGMLTAVACQFAYDNPAENGPQGAILGQLVKIVSGTPNGLTLDGSEVTEPLAGAVCTLEGTNRSSPTDNNGDFTISGVADGAYIVICRTSGGGENSLAALVAVEVSHGQTVDLGVIAATSPGAIAGQAFLLGQESHAGIAVFVPGTSLAARTGTDGSFTMSDVPEGVFTLRFEKDGYLSLGIEEVEVVATQTTTLSPVTLALSSGPSGTVSINQGAQISTSREVTLDIQATSEATLMALSPSSDFVDIEWQPTTSSMPWSFPDDGVRFVFVKFANANGLESQPTSDSILVDTLAPTDGSVVINNGAATTDTVDVTLTLSANDPGAGVGEMLIANDPSFAGATWQSFSQSIPWSLVEGDGTKSVYARFRDTVGHETTEAATGSILLDTSSPMDPTLWLDAEYTNATEVTVHCSAAGAATVRLSWDEAFADFLSYPYATTIPNVPIPDVADGTLHLYARFFDGAGNPSDVVSTSIVLDTTAPTRPELELPHPATPTTVTDYAWARRGSIFVPFATPSSDANVASYRVRDDYGIFDQVVDPTIEETVEGLRIVIPDTTPMGANKVFVAASDLAGNVSNETWFFLYIDEVAPAMGEVFTSVGQSPTSGYVLTQFNVTVSDDSLTWSSTAVSCRLDYGTTSTYSAHLPMDSDGFAWWVNATFHEHTDYHFAVVCSDLAGNEASSDDAIVRTGVFVGGDITSNTTWSAAGGPYRLADEVHLSSTLTIGAGAEVYSDGWWALITADTDEATVVAMGTQANPVIIHADIEVPALTFDWVIANGTHYYADKMHVHHSLVLGGTLYCIADRGGITGGFCSIEMNDLRGEVYAEGASVVFRNNLLTDRPLHFTTDSDAIQYNSFINTAGTVSVSVGCSDSGAYCSQPCRAADLSDNYWGNVETAVIASDRISATENGCGMTPAVNYLPILTAPHADTPPAWDVDP